MNWSDSLAESIMNACAFAVGLMFGYWADSLAEAIEGICVFAAGFMIGYILWRYILKMHKRGKDD